MNRLLSKIKLRDEEIELVKNAHEHLIDILNSKAQSGR